MNTRTRLDSLTAIRFVAAFAVLACHVIRATFPPGVGVSIATTGQFGVDFFFILSGFVLAWSARPGRSDRHFWLLRFARVWPLHAATFVVAVVLFWRETHPLSYLTNITLMHAWIPSPQVYWSLNGPSWTLSCEAFFYAAFPLLFRRLRGATARRLWMVAALCCIATVALPLIATLVPPLAIRMQWWSQTVPLVRLPQFVLGICVAGLIRQGSTARISPVLAGGATLGVMLVAGAFFRYDETQEWVTSAALTPLLAAVILGAALSDLGGGPQPPRWLVRLGEWSFALYLTHMFVVIALEPHLTGWLAFTAMMLVAIPLSGLAHELIEAPAERFLRARILRRPASVEPSSTDRATA